MDTKTREQRAADRREHNKMMREARAAHTKAELGELYVAAMVKHFQQMRVTEPDLTDPDIQGAWYAAQTGRYDVALRYFLSRTTPGANGCMETAEPYQKIRGVGEWTSLDGHTRIQTVYRAVLELATGEPLGELDAHHMCANPKCVNPCHLQAVTRTANVAEMHERAAYRRRIAELEAEVAKLRAEVTPKPKRERDPRSGRYVTKVTVVS